MRCQDALQKGSALHGDVEKAVLGDHLFDQLPLQQRKSQTLEKAKGVLCPLVFVEHYPTAKRLVNLLF